MNDKKWPLRSKSVCEFLVGLGIDPSAILETGINEYGYRRLILDADGGRQYSEMFDDYVCRVEPWPNGSSDYANFRLAKKRDEERVSELAARCPECGTVDLLTMPDVEMDSGS